MKKTILICILVAGVNFSFAQSNGLAKSIGVYVFPNDDQSAETQNKDESDCYKWAMEQTNYDPMNPTVAVADVVDTSPGGEAVIGAAKGAAAGAAIGSISGNLGEGASYGAIIGGLRGRRAKKSHDKQQQQANNAAAANANKEMANDYKKAFSTCLQAKGYTVN
jgi:hypothetical protein